jgi:hypothetical protein
MLLKIIYFLQTLKDDISDHLENIMGISGGSYIFFHLNLPIHLISPSSPESIRNIITKEFIHLTFAVAACILITIVTHIVKVEVSEWYKKFKE